MGGYIKKKPKSRLVVYALQIEYTSQRLPWGEDGHRSIHADRSVDRDQERLKRSKRGINILNEVCVYSVPRKKIGWRIEWGGTIRDHLNQSCVTQVSTQTLLQSQLPLMSLPCPYFIIFFREVDSI